MRFKYVLNEVLVGLWRNVTMTVAMIITMSISLLGLGASVLGYMQVDRMKTFYYGEIRVAIFMNDNVTEAERSSLDAALTSNPLVAEKKYESKEEAYKRFQELYADQPDFLKSVQAGQLPESFRVRLKDPQAYDQFAQSIQGVPGIQDVVDQGQMLDDLFNVFSTLQVAALIVASVMAVAALLLVGNTIQVAAYSKRREVAVMKLVGASNWFIQAPFVLEAMVAGVVGAVIGWLFLFAGKELLIDGPLRQLTTIITSIPMTNVWLQLPLMAGTGAIVSAVTAWVTLRFYLRV
jgi:cell division transport system permease protein